MENCNKSAPQISITKCNSVDPKPDPSLGVYEAKVNGPKSSTRFMIHVLPACEAGHVIGNYRVDLVDVNARSSMMAVRIELHDGKSIDNELTERIEQILRKEC